jgi:hypothetical protein
LLIYLDTIIYVDNKIVILPKWKKNAKEFSVGVNYHDVRGAQSSIPKPVIEVLGKPDTIKFVIKGKKVEIIPAKE